MKSYVIEVSPTVCPSSLDFKSKWIIMLPFLQHPSWSRSSSDRQPVRPAFPFSAIEGFFSEQEKTADLVAAKGNDLKKSPPRIVIATTKLIVLHVDDVRQIMK
jgi:hypothetical protein